MWPPPPVVSPRFLASVEGLFWGQGGRFKRSDADSQGAGADGGGGGGSGGGGGGSDGGGAGGPPPLPIAQMRLDAAVARSLADAFPRLRASVLTMEA